MSTHARRVAFYDAYEVLTGHLMALETDTPRDGQRIASLRKAVKMMADAFESRDDRRMASLYAAYTENFVACL